MTFAKDRIYSIVIFILLGVVCLQAYNIYNKNNLINQQQLLIESLQDSIQVIESDILYAIDLINDLEYRRDSIKEQLEEERLKKQEELSSNRKSQVGSGDRSERIRTYNFPQGRVSDHRINLTLYKLDQFLTGEALEEMISALSASEQAEKLNQLNVQ